MCAIVRRAIVPALLVIGGLASLIYGAIFHSVPVLEETGDEDDHRNPHGVSAGRPLGEALPPADGAAPFGGPPPSRQESRHAHRPGHHRWNRNRS